MASIHTMLSTVWPESSIHHKPRISQTLITVSRRLSEKQRSSSCGITKAKETWKKGVKIHFSHSSLFTVYHDAVQSEGVSLQHCPYLLK